MEWRKAILAGLCLFMTESQAQLVQQGPKLVGTGMAGWVQRGNSVALSADGNTAIVGAPRDEIGGGSALVFSWDGALWRQTGKLVGNEVDWGAGYGWAHRGSSVAVSADGNTAVVGAPGELHGFGAAWIFARTSSGWQQQGPKLVGDSAGYPAQQGQAVGISADGSTVIVGGPRDGDGLGASWVFTRTGGVWSQQGGKLVGTGAAEYSGQGSSVALSGDGNTAIVGGPTDHSNVGAVWFFTRIGGSWIQDGGKVVGTGNVGAPGLGCSVALSGDGSTAIVGGDWNDEFNGAAWVFARRAGAWSQLGERLIPSEPFTGSRMGSAVALSTDGNTALVGGEEYGRSGAAWVFIRTGDTWAQQGSRLVGTSPIADARQGHGVALSGDGNRAILGGPGSQEGVWAFARAGVNWKQEGKSWNLTNLVVAAKQGQSVAISADGTTVVVGGTGDAGGVLFGGENPDAVGGAAWAYGRTGDRWLEETKIFVTGSGYDDSIGESVALSADGNTAVVGSMVGFGFGGMRVWARTGGTWTRQGNKLVGSDSIWGQGWGSSVSVSGDGNTAIMGGGGARIFTRSGGAWTALTSLTVSGGFGVSANVAVAMSGDGKTALVAGIGAWIFTRSGEGWSQQGERLPLPIEIPTWVVPSIALSGDGAIAVVAARSNTSQAVAAWVFTRQAGTWMQQGEKLNGTGGPANMIYDGSSVAISSDGSTVILGGYSSSNLTGAAWAFRRQDGIWNSGRRLIGSETEGYTMPGKSVAVSGDGRLAIVGAPNDALGVGAAWVFSLPSCIVLLRQPAPGVAGATMAPSVTVQLQDATGSPVLEPGYVVTLSLTSGNGTLSGTVSQLTDASGVATFGDLSIDRIGSKQLTAASAGLSPAVSSAFVISAGAAAIVVATGGSGQGAAIGAPFAAPLRVTVSDAFGNPVSGATVTFTSPTGGPGAALSGGTAITDANGQASVTATANGFFGGPYPVTARVGTLLAAQFLLTNLPADGTAIPGLGLPGLIGLAVALAAAGLLAVRGTARG